MKRLLIIAMAAGLSGCSIFHSSKSAKHLVQRDSTYKSETSSIRTDTGSTIIREVTDSTFYSPAINLSKSFDADQHQLLMGLISGMYRIESPLLDISVQYDTLAKKLNLQAIKKPEQGSVRKEKTTVIKNGMSESSTQKTNVKVSDKNLTQNSERKPDYGWIWWLAGIIAIIIFALLLHNKLRASNIFARIFNNK